MNIIHSVFTLLFVAIGLLSLVMGLIVIIRRRTSWLFQTYLWTLLAAEFALIGFVAWDWLQLMVPEQIVLIALCLLGLYAVFRSFQAREKQAYRYTGWRLEFMEDVAFTLVFLFDVLAIIGAMELGMPVWGAAVIGTAGFFAGRQWLEYEKQRYLSDRKKHYERKLRKL